MDRYIGLDAHASSCTLGVLGPGGKRLGSHVVEANAKANSLIPAAVVFEASVQASKNSRWRLSLVWLDITTSSPLRNDTRAPRRFTQNTPIDISRSDAIENVLHDRQMVVVVLGDEVNELNRLHRLLQSWMQCCSDHLGIAETIEPFDKPTPGIGECR